MKFILLLISLTILFTLYAKAWVEPDQVPPEGNIAAPLNTGNSGQIKTGGLILNTGGATLGLIVDRGLVGIGTNTPQAILDITSTSGGFLPPRMTTAQRDTIGSPQFGLVIVNSDTKKVNIYNGSIWETVGADISAEGNIIYTNGDGREGDNFCQKSLITNDGLKGNSENINEGKTCGLNKICRSGICLVPTI